MANIIKDIGEIWTRLFDHRPFLNGEIKFFVREFEEKRSDREIEGLFQILENVTDIKDSHIDRLKLSSETHLPILQSNVDTALNKCERILEREQSQTDHNLESKRELRKAEWESFIQDMTRKCEKVDETFQEKEDDIREFYLDLQRKLHITPTSSDILYMQQIKDPAVCLRPSPKFIAFIKKNIKELSEEKLPHNIELIINDIKTEKTDIRLLCVSDVEWFQKYINKTNNIGISDNYVEGSARQQDELVDGEQLSASCDDYDEGTLDEVYENILKEKEKLLSEGKEEKKMQKERVFVHELLEGCELVLPKNEVVTRNPVLEARVGRLRREQEEREYKAMTRNVDMSKKPMPEDTIAFQMKMMNRHLIGVAQFILSVAAGFAFGFIGVELVVGDLDFGFRLLLGVMCALIIALAEIYFLAKHLSEEFEDVPLGPTRMDQVFTLKQPSGTKLHKD